MFWNSVEEKLAFHRQVTVGWMLHLLSFGLCAWGVCERTVQADEPCRLEIVDQEGWPVPLVELRTVHGVRLVSDNAGLICFDLPELMEQETFLTVIGHGYGVPVDGFGYRGVRLMPRPGATLQVKLRRTSLARRLGRLTGAGLFAESQKLGEAVKTPESGVLGCDSIQSVSFQRRRYHFWGDTNLANYPLGIFHMTGATTDDLPLSRLQPPLNHSYDYFRDAKNRPKAMVPMEGSGPVWLSGLAVVPDQRGTEHIVCTYSRITPPLTTHEVGLCIWNPQEERFILHRKVWEKSDSQPEPPPVPMGHVVDWKDSQGQSCLLFGDPLPKMKIAKSFEAWQSQDAWQVLTPQETIAAKDEQHAPVRPHSGSMAWNAYRQKWVTVFMQHFGKPSVFGEIWYAEADTPLGPWKSAVKILSHENYTFYNPRLRDDLSPPGSPILCFEGTYTHTFSDNKEPTPRYDYNQILYRLDLDQPELHSEAEE